MKDAALAGREETPKDNGPGCERHRGDPHNLCEACWALEPAGREETTP